MGAAASSLSRPSRITSSTKMKEQTKEVTDMAEALFQFMYKDYSTKEVWEMADKPEDYVIALSDLITQQFHVIGYQTERNQIGEIYFMKYEGPQSSMEKVTRGLTPPAHKFKNEKGIEHSGSQTGIDQQRETAKIIAFYFIRLFQILGALLMVVKDVNLIDLDKPASVNRPIISQYGTNMPRIPRLSYQSGGSVPGSLVLGPYEFLRNYMNEFSIDNNKERYPIGIFPALEGLQKYYKITDSLFFVYSEPDQNTVRSGTSFELKKFQDLGKFVMVATKDNRYQAVSIKIIIKSVTPDRLFEFKSPESYTDPLQKQTAEISNIVFKLIKDTEKVKPISIGKTGDQSGRRYYIFKEESADLAGSRGFDINDDKQFGKILEQLIIFNVYTDQKQTLVPYIPKKVSENSTKVSSTGELLKMSNPIIDEHFQGLKSKKIPPHCIARALQLLDLKYINSLTAYKEAPQTNICKFMIYGYGNNKTESMDKYLPLKSLAQLYGKVDPLDRIKMKKNSPTEREFQTSLKVLEAFVSKSAVGIPLGVKELNDSKQPNEAKDLQDAINRLKVAFSMTAESNPNSISQIALKKPDACKGRTDSIPLTDNVARSLQSAAHQLFAEHINHTVEITKFLKVIFNIKQRPDGTWEVKGPNASILFAGFPILDQLTDQARALLTDYYSKCETMYQSAVNIWDDSEKQLNPVIKNVAPSSRQNSNNNPVARPVPSAPRAPTNDPSGP